MKKEAIIHFSSMVLFFIVLTVFKKYFAINYIFFWLGGVVGTLAPDIDHIIYLYRHPHELTSQRVNYMLQKKEIIATFELMAMTRSERKALIFHTFLVQVIFLLLVVWVLTSSGSLFGRGLVLSFALHISVDQIVDLLKTENLSNWVGRFQIQLTKEQSTLVVIGFLVLLVFFALFT